MSIFQDPVLFSGTLRMNLDPFDVHTDEELWTSLNHSHLEPYVRSLDGGLMSNISEEGSNMRFVIILIQHHQFF